ncbi:MAG: DnaJ C-terminal domain-containing protein [Thermoguttaceae bacterium]
MSKDYYKVLEVGRNASQEEINKAYRNLARKYHPDLNPEDKTAKQKFQQVQAAYEILGDPQKREMYDRYGSSFETAGGGPRPGGSWSANPSGGFSFEDADFSQFFGDRFGAGGGATGFEDIFSQFTQASSRGRKSQGGSRRRGTDLRHEITVPFAMAVQGGQMQLSLARPTGQAETISVKIPPGIDDGKKIRLRGQGETAPHGGPAGDLILTVHIAPHPFFRRNGKHLQLTVPVTFAEAALGAKVDIPTPKGTVTLKVPPCTSGGSKLRVKAHGVAAKDGPGDLIAEVQIVMPRKLDDETRAAIERLARQGTDNPRAKLQW